MNLIILDEALSEFRESAIRYEGVEPGLGVKFREEVASLVAWIQEHPTLPRLRKGRYRRVNLKIFPHYVAYVIRDETIMIVAIAHGHRRPEFWMKRI